ncbi:MAG: 30S ribosomal protein S20 [Candidatus Hydrogenedentes bacterium]|nr:30S ribosomal protein S20 [Candidatus Hydrogenedentota bacterium]
MPHTKSAAKRMRTSGIKRQTNRAAKSRLASTRRLLLEASAKGDKTKAEEHFRTYCGFLDKAVKQGAIKANNASRHKSRAAVLLKK